MSVVFNPGDKVKLTRGDEVLLGEIVEPEPVSRVLQLVALGIKLPISSWQNNHGWTVAVVPSTPTPELPTADGIYLSKITVDGPWLFKLKDGDWTCINTNSPFPVGEGHLERNAPFTRLGSRESWRSSWANEIAEWVEGQPWTEAGFAAHLVREFGGAVVDE